MLPTALLMQYHCVTLFSGYRAGWGGVGKVVLFRWQSTKKEETKAHEDCNERSHAVPAWESGTC